MSATRRELTGDEFEAIRSRVEEDTDIDWDDLDLDSVRQAYTDRKRLLEGVETLSSWYADAMDDRSELKAELAALVAQTSLQSAALAALAAWRKLKLQRKWKEFLVAERELENKADALVASLEVTP